MKRIKAVMTIESRKVHKYEMINALIIIITTLDVGIKLSLEKCMIDGKSANEKPRIK